MSLWPFLFFSIFVILNAALLRTHLLRRMIQDLILFFQNGFWFFSFLSLPYFYFFIKIIITSLRGKNLLRVRSPQFPSPLTPFLLGHGLRRCLKNLPASEVSSVSYEQIRVALFFFQNSFWSFLSHHVIPNSFRDLILFFQKRFLILIFYHFFISIFL